MLSIPLRYACVCKRISLFFSVEPMRVRQITSTVTVSATGLISQPTSDNGQNFTSQQFWTSLEINIDSIAFKNVFQKYLLSCKGCQPSALSHIFKAMDLKGTVAAAWGHHRPITGIFGFFCFVFLFLIYASFKIHFLRCFNVHSFMFHWLPSNYSNV